MTVLDTSPPARTERRGISSAAVTTVRLTGEIDIFTSHALRKRLIRALRHSTNLLVLDLSEVTFCDTSGLAVLVGTQRRARSRGITLVLSTPRPAMSKLLGITGLYDLFSIVE